LFLTKRNRKTTLPNYKNLSQKTAKKPSILARLGVLGFKRLLTLFGAKSFPHFMRFLPGFGPCHGFFAQIQQLFMIKKF